MMKCKFHNLPNKNVQNYGFIPLARGSVRWIFMNSSLFSPAACIDAFPRCPFVACTFLSPFLYSFKIRKGCLLNLETSSVCERWGSCTKDPTSRIGFRIYDPSGQFTLVVTRWSCRNSSLDLRSAALFASSSSGVFSWPVIETFYNKRKKTLFYGGDLLLLTTLSNSRWVKISEYPLSCKPAHVHIESHFCRSIAVILSSCKDANVILLWIDFIHWKIKLLAIALLCSLLS